MFVGFVGGVVTVLVLGIGLICRLFILSVTSMGFRLNWTVLCSVGSWVVLSFGLSYLLLGMLLNMPLAVFWRFITSADKRYVGFQAFN